MPETNGHAPELEPVAVDTAPAAELDALLAGVFEPVAFEVAPGRSIEIRPLMLDNADRLYAGGLGGAALQRFMLARCVHINGRPLGDDNAARLPLILANRLVPVVMAVNGMEMAVAADAGEGKASDPKA